MILLLFHKVGTLDWARPFPADASSTSLPTKGPPLQPLPWPMAYRPWALAELTRRRPFVDTGHLVIIRRKLRSDISHRRLWLIVPTFMKWREYIFKCPYL